MEYYPEFVRPDLDDRRVFPSLSSERDSVSNTVIGGDSNPDPESMP